MKRLGMMGGLTAMVIATALSLTACKQGLGERCQVADDCEDGLVCAQATQTCQETTGGGIDALPPVDAGPDAPVDAPIDAAVDAAIDAAP